MEKIAGPWFDMLTNHPAMTCCVWLFFHAVHGDDATVFVEF